MKDNILSSSQSPSSSSSQKLANQRAYGSASPLLPASSSDTSPRSVSSSFKYGFSREDQLKMANEYTDKQLNVGDKWYLINSDWYTRWLKYIGKESHGDAALSATSPSKSHMNVSPEKINNLTLLERNETTQKYSLKNAIMEEVDYYTVPIELWSYLANCYGLTNPDNVDVIERVVIDDSANLDGETLRIELRRLNVSLSCSNWKSEYDLKVVREEMSRQTKLEDIVEKIRKTFNIPNEKAIKLYLKSVQYNTKVTPIELTKTKTLSNSGYGTDDIILGEVQEASGVNPPNNGPPPLPVTSGTPSVPLTSTTFSTQTRQSSRNLEYNSFSNRHNDYKPGLCGLSNLGNTCFMNSSLQCMSNVPLLTDYFRSNAYKAEINLVNPLGRKGEIAESYADLVNEMWSGQNSYTIPRNFKLNLSRFAPQFTGFQQQDSHELLAFLLDGLHEDLNRIQKKPYVELGSHVGKTDAQFAEESWQDHKKRNDSIIVDIFHGLLKSTLNCLVCNEISIKFDPFCYLSVPLPSKKERLIEFFFVPLDSTKSITKYKLSVFKNGTIQDLCSAFEQATNSSVLKGRLVVCDVYTNKFFKVYEPTELISLIRERDDIYLYEMPSTYGDQNYFKVKLHLKEKGTYMYNSSCFGLPLFFLIPKANLTQAAIYQNVINHLRRFLKDTSSEEINMKLNNSLNVNDEDDENSSSSYTSNIKMVQDQDDASPNDNNNDENEEEQNNQHTRSSQRLKNKSIQQSKMFNLFISKNDNIDSENSQISIQSDDSQLFDYVQVVQTHSYNNHYGNNSSQSSPLNSNHIISMVAEFTSTSAKRFYNKKPLEDVVEHPSCNSQLIKKKDVISISDCFNLYTKTEELSEQDYWYCTKCKGHQASTKKFDLWSMPQVLVVHLKRFSYTRSYRDKIDTLVDFPLKDLDMSNYLINKNSSTPTKYNLIAVSNHYGSLGGGHYTAFGLNRDDGRWYYFDDSSVSGSDEASVCTNAAYLLIYLRQDMHEKFIQTKSNGATAQAEKMDY